MKTNSLARTVLLSLLLSGSAAFAQQSIPTTDLTLRGRKVEVFQYDVDAAQGYPEKRKCYCALQYPEIATEKSPLLVVFCPDIFANNRSSILAPKDFFMLMIEEERSNLPNGPAEFVKKQAAYPLENRFLDNVRWAIKNFPVDANRVYVIGNTAANADAVMDIALRHGDLFAAVWGGSPSQFDAIAKSVFETAKPADIPFAAGYFQCTDITHEKVSSFVEAFAANKAIGAFFWGPGGLNPYGGDQKHWYCLVQYDLVHSYDFWQTIRRNAAYPAFSNASTDDAVKAEYGQRGAFFRWKNISDSETKAELALFLVKAPSKAKRSYPAESTADVTLRRLQEFKPPKGSTVNWLFGKQSGTATVGSNGLITLSGLKISTEETVLVITVSRH